MNSAGHGLDCYKVEEVALNIDFDVNSLLQCNSKTQFPFRVSEGPKTSDYTRNFSFWALPSIIIIAHDI